MKTFLLAALFALLISPLKAADEIPNHLLLGTWVRPDGGYELKISSVQKDGTAKAEYFNPSPIAVAEAKVGTEDGAMTLSIKFTQGNYAGNFYRLKLQDGRLVGKYFQAMSGQTYDIFFERVPQS